MTYGPKAVWTGKSTVNWVFHPMSPVLSSKGFDLLRVSFEMGQDSGDCKIRPVLRMSNDGVTWDSPVAIGTATRAQDGTTYGDAYEDVSATTKTKQYVQFGIQCQNESGADLEVCNAILKIESKES